MEQITGEVFPQFFSFRESIQLSYRCSSCGAHDQFEFRLPGFPGAGVVFLDPLSTKYFPVNELTALARCFPNVSLIAKQSHSVIATIDPSVPDSEKLPIHVFQRTCAQCKHVTLFHYGIGHGQQERGMNEAHRLVIHAVS